MSTVSLIIPTYNCARYVVEAIESVISQTSSVAQIIVVDDGSTDNSEEVLSSYIEQRKISYIRQSNSGPGAARNAGIKAATGEYIAFLDADDSLTSDSVKQRVDLLRSSPRMAFVFGDYLYQEQASAEGFPFLRQQRFPERFARLGLKTPEGTIFTSSSFDDIFDVPFFVSTNTVLVRTAALQTAGLFRTDIVVGEDTDMWLRLATTGDIGYVNAAVAIYNRFRGTLTTKDPRAYGEASLRFLEGLREKYASLRNAETIISRRLGLVQYDLGCHFARGKNIPQARRYFFKSIRSDPRSLLPYTALLFSLVPKRWRRSRAP